MAGLLSRDAAWMLAPFVAGIAYLALESLEVVLAEKVLRARGDRAAARTKP